VKAARSFDRRRVYSAVAFLPCFYLLVRFLPAYAFFTFVAVGILLAQYEYYRLHFTDRWTLTIGAGLALGLLVTVAAAAPPIVYPLERALVSFVVAVILLAHLFAGRDQKTVLSDSAVLAFGVLYIAWLLSHLISIRQFEEGVFLVFFLFVVTWGNDIAAYYSGTLWGRHQMAPETSPKKTWEGAVGGLVGSLALACACRAWFLPSLSLTHALGVGFLLGIAAPLGDLCESLLKRCAGVKDSGGLIPGHGGMLDRIDSLIFTTPAFYYYLLIIKTP
jgi:phosphatidate cytidylyltransferase